MCVENRAETFEILLEDKIHDARELKEEPDDLKAMPEAERDDALGQDDAAWFNLRNSKGRLDKSRLEFQACEDETALTIHSD